MREFVFCQLACFDELPLELLGLMGGQSHEIANSSGRLKVFQHRSGQKTQHKTCNSIVSWVDRRAQGVGVGRLEVYTG